MRKGKEDELEKSGRNETKKSEEKVVVACQGAEGSYSQIAAKTVFDDPDILFMKNFEGVYKAVETGLCRYGVLPVRNSSAGPVKEVTSLLREYSLVVEKIFTIPIKHTLLTKKGMKISDITEIYSHPQAIKQCDKFLESLGGIKITECENTASAARMVSESLRMDIAAVSSIDCAEIYDLEVYAEEIQTEGENNTGFIVVTMSG